MSLAHIIILSEYLASTASRDTDEQPFMFLQKAEILRCIGDRQADIEAQHTAGDEEDSDDDNTELGAIAAGVHVPLVHDIKQIRDGKAELQRKDTTSEAPVTSVSEAEDGENAEDEVVSENNTTERVLMQNCSMRMPQVRLQGQVLVRQGTAKTQGRKWQ
jgi:hypothetical protein